MTAHEQTTVAALDTQAFALMGRLHVILRRQTGRITDIEYMRIDPQYCRHVLEIAELADSDDMRHICERLQHIFFGPEGLFVRLPPKPPLIERISSSLPDIASGENPNLPGSALGGSTQRMASGAPEEIDRAYIGRLR